MTCIVPLIAGLCLFEPSALTVRGQLSTQVGGGFQYHVGATNFGGGHLGRVSAEMLVPLTRSFSMSYGIEHSSLLDTNRDRGEERLYLTLEWRPFSGR